ncbi:MAG: STAS domain-containing protein [Planctomycetota bacterium]|nr:STAS domain-containing protein [Planctomycetota bacterium]
MVKKDVDDFQIEWHGNCVVILPAANIEHLRWDVVDNAAQIVMQPLKRTQVPTVVFDLSEVKYFGSVFLALLLRCHKYVKERGGDLVLCGPSQMAKELLSVTALDTLWAIYETREEAIAALEI